MTDLPILLERPEVPVGVRDPETGAACCSGCGDCCRVVALDHTKAEYMRRPLDPANQRWIQYRLRRISKAEALRRNPAFRRFAEDYPRVYYRCTWFDETTNRCLHHEQRPPICRDFPWYGEPPVAAIKSFPRCSYWWDLPQSQWPAFVHPDREVIPLTLVQTSDSGPLEAPETACALGDDSQQHPVDSPGEEDADGRTDRDGDLHRVARDRAMVLESTALDAIAAVLCVVAACAAVLLALGWLLHH